MAKRNPAPNPAMKLGFITFSTIESPDIDVTVRLAKDTPKMTGGYGGWEIVNRPRRRGTLEWVGVEPYEVTIDLLFDTWGYSRSLPFNAWVGKNSLDVAAERLTNDVREMDQMARPVALGRPSPQIKVTGKVVPIDPDMVWIISAIKWGDAIFNSEGFILRQECTVSLLQADGGEHANVIGPVKGPKKPSKVPQFHIWKKGNTFELLSIKYYGNASYRVRIMKLNHIRDWKKVKVGQKIKLPRP